MKQIAIIFTIILFISCKPKQHKPVLVNEKIVQDYSNLFSNKEIDSLTNFILKYEAKTTNEICVMTIDSLPKGVEILYHATNLANNLKIGKTHSDNGLLLLIALKNRQVAFATGFGTEKTLTDSICKNLINSTLIPNFKNENYYLGIRNVLDSIKTIWH